MRNLSQYLPLRLAPRVRASIKQIFQAPKLKRILGGNLAAVLIATSILPGNIKAENIEGEQTVVAITQSPITTEIPVRYPISEVKINQGYRLFHPGVDFEGVTGDPVNPIMNGRVVNVQRSRFLLGNAITVEHENGLTSVYAHLSKIEVKEGDIVTNFTKIGEVGSTGRSTGDHLHMEIYKNGRAVNPTTILPPLR